MPSYATYTWTLDYSRESDFDDNIGHWQVMPHPTKPNYSRVLYSCELKLYKWIPEFIVNFLTKTALIESTTWVKRESEKIKVNIDGSSDNSNINSNSKSFGSDVQGSYKELEDGSVQYIAKHLNENFENNNSNNFENSNSDSNSDSSSSSSSSGVSASEL